MFGLPLAFSAPIVLSALVVLPALWYLLRLTPPRPREISFPPLRLILDLQAREEPPARTPWWLMLLRLGLAALIIFAMAGPIWNPLPASDGGRGPLLVLLDDGWPWAPTWTQRVAAASERMAAANRDSRPAALVPMSDGAREIAAVDTTRANERLRTLKPAPFSPDRMQVLPAVQAFLAKNPQSEIIWIADGLARGQADAFAQGLAQAAGDARVHIVREDRLPRAVASTENAAGGLEAQIVRADARSESAGVLRAFDKKGLAMGETRFDFGAALETKAQFDLPIELRNEIARVEIDGEHSAGAVS